MFSSASFAFSSISVFEEVEEVLTDILASRLSVWNKGTGSSSTVNDPKEVETEDLGELVGLIFREDSKKDLVELKELWEIVSFKGELALVFVEASQTLFFFFTDFCLEAWNFQYLINWHYILGSSHCSQGFHISALLDKFLYLFLL